MKRILCLALVLTVAIISFSYAFNWRDSESGRSNIKLEGWLNQPGYIVFEDGNGNLEGRLWAHEGKLYFTTSVIHTSDLETLCSSGSTCTDSGTAALW